MTPGRKSDGEETPDVQKGDNNICFSARRIYAMLGAEQLTSIINCTTRYR